MRQQKAVPGPETQPDHGRRLTIDGRGSLSLDLEPHHVEPAGHQKGKVNPFSGGESRPVGAHEVIESSIDNEPLGRVQLRHPLGRIGLLPESHSPNVAIALHTFQPTVARIEHLEVRCSFPPGIAHQLACVGPTVGAGIEDDPGPAACGVTLDVMQLPVKLGPAIEGRRDPEVLVGVGLVRGRNDTGCGQGGKRGDQDVGAHQRLSQAKSPLEREVREFAVVAGR